MQESIIHGRFRSASFRGACLTALLLMPPGSLTASVPVCQLPANASSISILGASSAPAELHVEGVSLLSANVEGTVHLYLRNDGPTQINQLCVTSLLSDNKEAPQAVKLALLQPGQDKAALEFTDSAHCFPLQQPWNYFEERPFEVYVRAARSSIPLSGSLNLETAVSSQEKAPPEPTPASPKVGGRTSAVTPLPVPAHTCVSSSKAVGRQVILLPSRDPLLLYLPLLSALGAGVFYYVFCRKRLEHERSALVGGPQWSFGTSFATNFTVGTGLMSLLLGGSVITDALHYMTKLNYAVLGILFAAILLLAPAIFSFFSSPQPSRAADGKDTVVFVGGLSLFLATAGLMVGAVIGQLTTVGFAIAEIQFRGYIDLVTMCFFFGIVVATQVGAFIYAYRSSRSYLDQLKPEEHIRGEVESMMEKVAMAHGASKVDWNNRARFTAPESLAFENLIKKHGPEIPKWNMF